MNFAFGTISSHRSLSHTAPVPCEKRTSGESTAWKKVTSLRSAAASTYASNFAGSLPSGLFSGSAAASHMKTRTATTDTIRFIRTSDYRPLAFV